MVAKKLVEARDLGKRDKKSPTIRPASFREHPLDPDGLAHAMLPAAALLVGAAAWAPHRVVPALWQPHQCPACTPSGRADSAARAAPGHVRMVEQPIAFRGFRRRAYEALAPLDRGDFRWEFLVPWTNKTLSTTDKFIVCSVFIGLSFSLQSVFDEGASVGVHLSYIAQFFSYAMGDPIGFRLLAVLTSVLEIGGNLLEENSGGLFVGGLRSDWWIPDTEDVFPVLVRAVGTTPVTPWACPRCSLGAALASNRVYRWPSHGPHRAHSPLSPWRAVQPVLHCDQCILHPTLAAQPRGDRRRPRLAPGGPEALYGLLCPARVQSRAVLAIAVGSVI